MPECSGCPPGMLRYRAFSDLGHAGIRSAMRPRVSIPYEIGSQYSSNLVRAPAERNRRERGVRAVKKKDELAAEIRTDVACATSCNTGAAIGRRQVRASITGKWICLKCRGLVEHMES
jgi:hypothetical protein